MLLSTSASTEAQVGQTKDQVCMLNFVLGERRASGQEVTSEARKDTATWAGSSESPDWRCCFSLKDTDYRLLINVWGIFVSVRCHDGRSLTCSHHSGIMVSCVSDFSSMVGALEPPEGMNWRDAHSDIVNHSQSHDHSQWHRHLNTSILQSKLAVESSYQLAVPRCIMGIDSGLEGLSPNCWSTRTHLERNQLVHTWNKQTKQVSVDQLGMMSLTRETQRAGLTTLLQRTLQAAPRDHIGDFVVLWRQHW